MFRFICTFLTKAACCRNIEIVLHPTTLSYIYIYIVVVSIVFVVVEVETENALYKGCGLV